MTTRTSRRPAPAACHAGTPAPTAGSRSRAAPSQADDGRRRSAAPGARPRTPHPRAAGSTLLPVARAPRRAGRAERADVRGVRPRRVPRALRQAAARRPRRDRALPRRRALRLVRLAGGARAAAGARRGRAELDVGRALAHLAWDPRRDAARRDRPFARHARLPAAPVPRRRARGAPPRARTARAGAHRRGGRARRQRDDGRAGPLQRLVRRAWSRRSQRYFRWISLAAHGAGAALARARLLPGRLGRAAGAHAPHGLPIAIALGAGFTRGAVNTVRDAGRSTSTASRCWSSCSWSAASSSSARSARPATAAELLPR